MCHFAENVRGILEPTFGIGVDKGRDAVGHHQHLINFPREDDIIYQSVQKVKPPRAENLVRDDEVLLR